MKQLIKMAGIGVILMVFLNGCALGSSPLIGVLYTDVKGPIHSDATVRSIKTGEACAYSILGIIANGDASIRTAMDIGGINKVATVDYKVTSFLIFGASFCTIITGEE